MFLNMLYLIYEFKRGVIDGNLVVVYGMLDQKIMAWIGKENQFGFLWLKLDPVLSTVKLCEPNNEGQLLYVI